jgi:hypothetical protein
MQNFNHIDINIMMDLKTPIKATHIKGKNDRRRMSGINRPLFAA